MLERAGQQNQNSKLVRIAAAAIGVLCVDLGFAACSSGSSGTESLELVQIQEAATGDTVSASDPVEETDTDSAISESDTQEAFIYVYVCGAVNSPGVVELTEGSRVYEAIEAAGGFTEEADESWLNLAMILEDQAQITVLTMEETANQEPSAAAWTAESGESAQTGGGLVNLNTASSEQLESLPGIGEAKAQAIIAYREENGAFSSIEELQNVSGIGEATYTGLKDLITVD